MRELEVRVRVDEGDEVLPSVSASADQGDPFGLGRDGGGGITASSITEPYLKKRSGSGRGRVRPGLLTVRRDRGSDGQKDPLDPARLLEPLNNVLDLLDVLDAVPEQAPSRSGERTIGPLKVPSPVLVVRLGRPEQSLVVLLDRVENVVDDLVQNPVARGQELGHDRGLALGVRDDGDAVERLVTIDRVESRLELVEDLGDARLARSDVRVALLEYLSKRGGRHGLFGGLLVELVSTSDQGTRTGVGEEFLLKHVGGDDGDRRSSGEGVQELLDLPELELGPVLDPRFLHQAVVLLVQVDRAQLLTGDTVEEPTLFVQVDDLHGLQNPGQLSSSDVGIDVQQLTLLVLGQRGQDWEASGPDGSLDGSLVDRGDFADEPVLGLVEVGRAKDAGRNRSRSCSETFESRSELEVFLQKDAPGDLQSLGICHRVRQPAHTSAPHTLLDLDLILAGDPNPILVIRDNTLLFQNLVQLRASTVQDDRVESEPVQEGEREGEVVQLVGEDGTADPAGSYRERVGSAR